MSPSYGSNVTLLVVLYFCPLLSMFIPSFQCFACWCLVCVLRCLLRRVVHCASSSLLCALFVCVCVFLICLLLAFICCIWFSSLLCLLFFVFMFLQNTFSPMPDLNQRPFAYKANALTTELKRLLNENGNGIANTTH